MGDVVTLEVDVEKQTLTMKADTKDEAFSLGELWGQHADAIDVAWGGEATLHFRLLPTKKTEEGEVKS